MRYLTFHIRFQFQCEDGSIFSWIFEEGRYCFADAPNTIVDGDIFVYTPGECIGRAVRTFFSGLTAREREQAGRTLRIMANQQRYVVDREAQYPTEQRILIYLAPARRG